MPLAGYQPEVREVPIANGNVMHLRAMNVADFAVLLREHFPDIDGVFDLFQGGLDKMNADQFKPLALMLISQAPGLVANIIAVAAGEGDASDAEKLPAPIQVKALLAIGELTFMEVGGVKKFVGEIAALLTNEQVKNLMTKIPRKSRR